MKLYEGYTLVKLTEDTIVQEKKMGETGLIRMYGNPNPPPEEHEKVMEEAANILMKGYRRRLLREQQEASGGA